MKISTILLLVFLIFAGCSSNKSNPIIPVNSDSSSDSPSIEPDKSPTDHQLLGTFTATFDIESLTASIEPNRALNTHYNVTAMIPAPTIQVNSWDPVEQSVDVDITLHNPSLFDAFDVRLIIYTDDPGHLLLNPDNWTHLYDIPEGLWSNPFRAYAKSVQNRRFAGGSYHSENLKIRCPGGNFTVQFAVDASHPGNCKEPYEISNFRQENLLAEVGASAWIHVDILDWQYGVSEVKIDCEAITGATDIPFTYDSGSTWELELVNNNGVPSGEYGAILYAKCYGSGDLELIDRIAISVTDPISGIPLSPELKSIISFPQFCKDVYTQGNYAYINDFYNGIKIADVSNINKPEIIGIMDFSSLSDGPFPYNEYLFCQTVDGDLVIVDISDPTKPEIIAQHGDWEFAGDLKIHGNYAYFRWSNRLYAFDISDVHSIEDAGSIELGFDSAWGWTIQANYAYLTYSDSPEFGFWIIDISDPHNMELAGSFESNNKLGNLAVSGDYAFVFGARQQDNLLIIDISNPVTPLLINEVLLDKWVIHFAHSGNYLYCLEFAGDSFFIIDITDPQNPSEIGTIPDHRLNGISFSGSVPCIWGEDSFEIESFATLDVSDPSNPVIAGTLDNGRITDFVVSGDYLYTSVKPEINPNNNPGLRTFDITNPEEPEYISGYLKYGTGIAMNENLVYLMTEYGQGLCVVDISDPSDPHQMGTLGGFKPGNVELVFEEDAVFAAGYYFYDTHTNGGALQRANVSNPSNPYHSGQIDPFHPESIEVFEDYAYVSSSGLYIIDISDSYNLEILHYINCDMYGMHISDSKFYCCVKNPSTYYTDFLIYDISSPSAPVKMGELTRQYAADIYVSGDYAYFVTNGLKTIDVSDPTSPVYISYLELPHLGDYDRSSIQVQENYAYIMTDFSGISIIKLWD